jgi:hypothetical protein
MKEIIVVRNILVIFAVVAPAGIFCTFTDWGMYTS